MLRFLFTLLLINAAVIIPAFSQGLVVSLTGVTAINAGSTYTYNVVWKYNGMPTSAPAAGTYTWQVYGGTAHSSGSSYAAIQWANASGAIVYQYTASGTTYTANLTVGGSGACALVPSVTFSSSSTTCSPRQVSYTGTPPTGVIWYWQTSSTGTSTTNSSNTYTVTSPGTYYVRPYNTSLSCWGTDAAQYGVSEVTPAPAEPPAPIVSTDLCGSKALMHNNPPAGVTWYWQGTNPNGTSTSNSGTDLAFTSGIYFLRARNDAGCWSATSSSASVVVNDWPSVPSSPVTTSNSCGPQTLSKSGSPPANVAWYWQGTNSSGTDYTSEAATSATYSAPASGTYYLRARHSNGCWSQGAASVVVTVNPFPDTPAAPSESSNTCGPKTLAFVGTPPAGITWYWQGTNANGTSTSNSNTSIDVSTTGTYYLRARNNASSCWSINSSSQTVSSFNDKPATPPNPTAPSTCGTQTLSKVGTPTGSGVVWYWQGTNSEGTDYTSAAATGATYLANTSGIYYLRARHPNGCWSNSASVSVTTNPLPATPDAPIVLPNDCGSKPLQHGSSPAGITWFWQGNNPDGFSESNSGTDLAFTTGTYYLKARNNSTGCWSANSSSVYVVIHVPPTPPAPTTTAYDCGPQTLTKFGTLPEGVSWFWQGTNPSGTDYTSEAATGATYSASSNHTYYLRPRSSNGCWGFSSSVPVSVYIPPTPSVPQNLSAIEVTSSSFKAVWSGASGADGYVCEASTTDTFASIEETLNTTETFVTFSGLDPGSTYFFRVRARKNCISSLNSDTGSAILIPPPPIALTSINVTNSSFYVRWSTSNGATQYFFDISTTEDFSTFVYENTTSSGGSGFTGNPNGSLIIYGNVSPSTSEYYYRIRAANSSGTSVNSNVITVVRFPAKPLATLATNITHTSFTTNWNPVIAATGYRVDIAKDKTFTSFLSGYNNLLVTGTNLVVTGMAEGGVYYYRVRANNLSGTSENSNTIRVITWKDYNYVISTDVMKEDIHTESDMNSVVDVGDLLVRYDYFDGIGRPVQSIGKQSSPLEKDVVQSIVYDPFGRQVIKYLPYVSSSANASYQQTAIADQLEFYANGITDDKIENDAFPYGETRVEASPLSRIIKQGAPGAAWQPDVTDSYLSSDHTVKKAYETNITNEVLLFSFSKPDAANPMGSVKLNLRSYYAPNQLYKSRTKDEQGNEVIEFADKQGRTVLKKVQADATTYAQTYYVYDNFGNLVSVIQPEGVKNIVSKLSVSPWSTITGLSVDAAFNLTKTASSSYGNGAAVSIEALGAGQDGWVEMTAEETNTSRMIGLAASNINHSTNIQYALELRNDGHIYVWEGNIAGADLGSYATGTVVRVAREGPEIKYYVDNIHRQTTPGVGNGTLLIDLAINHTGGTIKNVNFSFAATTILQQALTNFAFRYTYDSRDRMTQKLVPGASVVYMVYDNRDRLVLTQDGNLRKTNSGTDLKQWLFTKYDALNRPVSTGSYTAETVLTQSEMQTRVNTYYDGLASNNGAWFESFSSNAGNVHGYDNRSFPVIQDPLQYLTVTYYDDYNFKDILPDLSLYEFKTDELPGEQKTSYHVQLKGQVTGTKIKVLDGGVAGGTTWLQGVNYFDDKYRVIQSISDNITAGIDRITNVYGFPGKILKSKTTHYASWKDLVGVSIIGNKIIKTAAVNSWGTAGAASIEKLPAGQNGWIEVTVSENNTNRMIGFSDVNMDANYPSIDYALYLTSGNLHIYESGVSAGNKGPTVLGDVLRVERTGTTIKYYKNGSVVYTSMVPSTTDLIADVALNNNGSTLSNIRTSFTGNPRTITRTMTYDHAGRLLKTRHRIDQQPEVLLAFNEYNELGQLIDKKLHSTQSDASDARQSIDYRYNVRGWLTSMNNASLVNNVPSNDDSGDYFGFELGYNTDIGVGNSLLYNGNIGAMKWSNDLGFGEVKEKSYLYGYDAMNRITSAAYKENRSGWNVATNNAFSEPGYQYDLNGNIKNLTRYDLRGSTAPMDNLIYDYGTGTAASNKLLKVSEKTGADAGDKFKGFADGANVGNDYTYDNNGNLITDQNKGITSAITYNYLNLPATVQRGANSVTYIYDASGRKLSQLMASGGGTRKRTDYLGEFQYENSSLQSIAHEEGRAVMSENKTMYTHNGEQTDDIIPVNSTVDLVTLNGEEKYVRVTSDGATVGTGIFPIGNAISVVQGERYKIRTKAYHTGSSVVYLLVKTNNTNLSWAQARIPAQAAAESWIEVEVTIPIGHTTLQAGLAWNTVTAGQQFFMNEFEIIKLSANTLAEYQYHLKDHLGNVRLTFTTKDQVETFTATSEIATQSTESNIFSNYNPTDRDLFDHTDAGTTYTYAQLLHGGHNSQIALAKSLSVMPGDTIKAEVYAKYQELENPGAGLTGFAAALTSAFGFNAPVVGDPGTVFNALDDYGTIIAGGFDHSEDETAPKAYLNILLFDRDHNFVDAAYKQIDIDDEQGEDLNIKDSLGYLNIEKLVTTPGYAYIFLSNENPVQVDVYFDDMKVEHVKSPIVQMDDYYPFGLTFNSYSRENSVAQKYKYNGKEEQDELGLGWLDFGRRMYQPELGRFFAADRFADKYRSMTPYHYAANNPTLFVDINGDSLYIRNGNESYLYNNGKLSNDKGKDVTNKAFRKNGEARNNFLGKAAGGLAKIGKTEAGAAMISKLQSSKFNFTIKQSSINRFDPDNENNASALMNMDLDNKHPFQKGNLWVEGMSFNEIGSGGSIYWNPDQSMEAGGVTEGPELALAHEAFHGQDSGQGLLDRRFVYGSGTSMGEEVGEVRAVYNTNLIRQQMGHSGYRQYYSNPSIPLVRDGKPINIQVYIPQDCR